MIQEGKGQNYFAANVYPIKALDCPYFCLILN